MNRWKHQYMHCIKDEPWKHAKKASYKRSHAICFELYKISKLGKFLETGYWWLPRAYHREEWGKAGGDS